MPTRNTGWHEPLHHEQRTAGSSNRSFGLIFATACGALGALAWYRHNGAALLWFIAALSFLLLALFAHPLLGPLNRVWAGFARLLSKIVNPLVMAIVFFGAVTPLGWLLRLFGKDPLRARFEPALPSYWIERPSKHKRHSMRRQF